MNIILSTWKLTLVLLLLLSLTLNVAMFVGGTIYKMASSAFSAATGVRTMTVQHAGEVAELGSDLTNERRVSVGALPSVATWLLTHRISTQHRYFVLQAAAIHHVVPTYLVKVQWGLYLLNLYCYKVQ